MKVLLFIATVTLSLTAGALSIAPPTFYSTSKSNVEGFKFVDKTIAADLAKDQKVNTLVSPTSLHYALSLAINGAGNDGTLNTFLKLNPELLLKGHNVSDSLNNLNWSNKALLDYYSPISKAQPKENEWEPSEPVVSINNMVAHTTELGPTGLPKFEFSSEFQNVARDSYQAESFALDFKSEASVDVINSWVSKNTNDMIPEIIDASTLKKLIWAVVNTVYFEGQWAHSFHVLPPSPATQFTNINNEVQDTAVSYTHLTLPTKRIV